MFSSIGSFFSLFFMFDWIDFVGLPVCSDSDFLEFLESKDLLMLLLFCSVVVVPSVYFIVPVLEGTGFVTLSRSLFDPNFFFVVVVLSVPSKAFLRVADFFTSVVLRSTFLMLF